MCFVWVTQSAILISMRCIIWNILYFWKLGKVGFDNVKCTIVGKFIINDDFTLRCGAVTIRLLWRTWSGGSSLFIIIIIIIIIIIMHRFHVFNSHTELMELAFISSPGISFVLVGKCYSTKYYNNRNNNL